MSRPPATGTRALMVGAMLASGLLAPTAARAQSRAPATSDDTGWYVGLSAGAQARADAEDNIGAATVFHNGFDISAAIGHRFQRVAVEGEALYINNNNAREIITGLFDEEARGNVGLNSVLANVYFDLGTGSTWKPYVGAGVGLVQSHVYGLTSKTLSAGIPGILAPTVVDTSSQQEVAWDFKAGIGYQATRQTRLFVGYRYFHGSTFHLDSPTIGGLDVSGAKVQAIEAGFRAGF